MSCTPGFASRLTSLSLALVLGLMAPALAQDPGEIEERGPAEKEAADPEGVDRDDGIPELTPEQIAKREAEDNEALEKIRYQVKGAHWYRVRLTSRETMEGLSRRKNIWEKPGSTPEEWLPAERTDEGAGVRLWYVRRQQGVVFVDAAKIVFIEKKREATDDDVTSIFGDHKQARERAEEGRRRALERLAMLRERHQKQLDALRGTDSKANAANDKALDEAAMAMLTPEERELLSRFPTPTYTPETKEKLRTRAVVSDIYPNAEERAFLDSYDSWVKALASFKKARALAATETGGSGESDTKGKGEGDDPKPTDKKPGKRTE